MSTNSGMSDTDLMDLAYRANPEQRDAALRASLPGLRAVAAAAWDDGFYHLAGRINLAPQADIEQRNPYRARAANALVTDERNQK